MIRLLASAYRCSVLPFVSESRARLQSIPLPSSARVSIPSAAPIPSFFSMQGDIFVLISPQSVLRLSPLPLSAQLDILLRQAHYEEALSLCQFSRLEAWLEGPFLLSETQTADLLSGPASDAAAAPPTSAVHEDSPFEEDNASVGEQSQQQRLSGQGGRYLAQKRQQEREMFRRAQAERGAHVRRIHELLGYSLFNEVAILFSCFLLVVMQFLAFLRRGMLKRRFNTFNKGKFLLGKFLHCSLKCYLLVNVLLSGILFLHNHSLEKLSSKGYAVFLFGGLKQHVSPAFLLKALLALIPYLNILRASTETSKEVLLDSAHSSSDQLSEMSLPVLVDTVLLKALVLTENDDLVMPFLKSHNECDINETIVC